MLWVRLLGCCQVFILSVLTLYGLWGAASDDAVARGRQFYQTGQPVSGRTIQAFTGRPPVAVPAAALPCAGCHGRKGRGRSEGGMVAPDITWQSLTRPYEVTTPGGRKRVPYDEAGLKRAVTMGLDSSGNRLDAVMPRFALTVEEGRDLVAYLKAMEFQPEPGVSPQHIQVGVLLAGDHGNPQALAPLRRLLLNAARLVNDEGGIYHRELRLSFLTCEEMAQNATDLLEKKPLFALLAQNLIGHEDLARQLAMEVQLPVLAAGCGETGARPRYLFSLSPSPLDLADALVQQARGREVRPAAIVHGPATKALALALADQLHLAGGGTAPLLLASQPGQDEGFLLGQVLRKQIKSIFFLGLGDSEADGRFWQQVRRSATPLDLYVTGTTVQHHTLMTGPSVATVTLALPAQLKQPSLEAMAWYGKLVNGTNLPQQPRIEHAAILAAFRLLSDRLARLGRDPDAEALVTELEKTRDYETGLVPRLTFGPNQHTGSLEVRLFRLQDGQRLEPLPINP